MAGRANFGQITETDFSSLLQALSASPKGRLFLDEYRRRNRSEEAAQLFDSMKRIETTMAGMRDQFQPERLAEELLNIAMTLDIALDGAVADPEGDDIARRFALIGRAQLELASLVRGIAGEDIPRDRTEDAAPAIELTADQSAFFQELGLGDHEPSPGR